MILLQGCVCEDDGLVVYYAASKEPVDKVVVGFLGESRYEKSITEAASSDQRDLEIGAPLVVVSLALFVRVGKIIGWELLRVQPAHEDAD